ncbi:MFS transporter [Azoarcus sp. DN11]|uniref:MFS transporter n=1 Tax=Azoarcus sp. DN11 TaxID=356837 RepID=UPI000EB3F736|nr:MFS transporter [Azoarcus sp. DN11]AYH43526.1 hypothetical protein CDA09_09045 [Azoarcus sp. DN11]
MNRQDLQSRTSIFMSVMIVAELTSAFEVSMVYAALATLFRIYGDPIGVGWLITGFLLVSAAGAALVGRLGDLYGRSQLLLAMLVFAFIGSTISAFATSLSWVVAGRAIQGVAAAILPLCYGLVRERLPVKRVPVGIGILAGTAALGAALGYLLGGVIVDNLPWQSLFYVSAGLALISFVLVWMFVPPSAPPAAKGRLDMVGGVLFVPAITGILFAITRARSWGWVDPRTLSVLAASVGVLGFWVWYELRHKNPLIDVRLLAMPQIALANICFACAAFGAFQSQMIILPLMQQPEWTLVGLGASATVAGMLKGGASLLGSAGAPWGGYISGRRGGRFALVFGAGLLTVTWGATTAWHGSLWFVAFAGVVSIVGMTIVYAAVPNLILEAAPAHRTSEATGLSSVVRAIFGALGAQVIAFVLASSTVSDPARGPGSYPTAEAYASALGLVTLACVACLVAALLLPKRNPTVAAPDGVGLGIGRVAGRG